VLLLGTDCRASVFAYNPDVGELLSTRAYAHMGDATTRVEHV
jgi:hypothetical protein